MESNDNRPYIRGLDLTEYQNLKKQWFKWDHLYLKFKGNNPDMHDETVCDFIYFLETEMDREIGEFAEELDKSQELNDAYINGLLDAYASTHKNIEGEKI